MNKRIYYLCSCIIEFIKLVAKRVIKCLASYASYLFSSTHLINSIKHELSCKIYYTFYIYFILTVLHMSSQLLDFMLYNIVYTLF